MVVDRKSYIFISFIRAFAALAVVWDHLVGLWTDLNHVSFAPLEFMRSNINIPFSITQDFGFFAVSLFFLVSGFIITHAAQYENQINFFFRRIFRIYPPLIISLLIIFTTYRFAEWATGTPNYVSQFSFLDTIKNSLLINFFFEKQNVVNGVTWTLIIEMTFYIICGALIKWIQHKPLLAMVTMSGICAIFVFFNINNFNVSNSVFSFIPYLLLGQNIYYFITNKTKLYQFIIISAFNISVILYGTKHFHTDNWTTNDSYPISLAYAYLVFLVLLLIDEKIKINSIVKFFADISYSLYLNHYMLGMLLVTMFYSYIKLPYWLSLAVSLVIITVVSFTSYLLLEKPSKKWSNQFVGFITNEIVKFKKEKVRNDQTIT